MPGYKTQVITDKAISFWTFDADTQLSFLNNHILYDEINNYNPMIVHGNDFTLEHQSLNDLERVNQASISLARRNSIDDYPPIETLQKTYFEVTHNSTYQFPYNGNFTIEFLYYKDRESLTRSVYGIPSSQVVMSPLINKGEMLKISLSVGSGSSQNYLMASFDNRSLIIYEYNYPIRLFEQINHVIFTHECNLVDTNEYESILRLYVNGRLYAEDKKTYFDTFPSLSNNDSWLFGAVLDDNDLKTGWNRERLDLDQIAIYQESFSDEMVSNHYRKTATYETIITKDRPNHYWRMADITDNDVWTLEADIGQDGNYFNQPIREQDGPERLVQAVSVLFPEKTYAVIPGTNEYEYERIVNTNNDYTFEIWFRIVNNNRSIIFMAAEGQDNFQGLQCWINSKDSSQASGWLQIGESAENYINIPPDLEGISPGGWNNGEWYCLQITRKNNDVFVWINSLLFGQYNQTPSSNSDPSILYLMSIPPDFGNKSFGNLCHVAYYPYSLTKSQIYSRNNYDTRYYVSGFTFLQGNPFRAKIRIYDHLTGEKISELYSDATTGQYIYYSPNQRYVDVVSMIENSGFSTKHRIHGPLLPAEEL